MVGATDLVHATNVEEMFIDAPEDRQNLPKS